MSLKITGIGKRMVIKPFLSNQKETNFGIVLSEKEKGGLPKRGEILSFGEDAQKFGLQIGDQVIFREFSPTEIELEGEKFLLLDCDDVLGKIEKN